MTDPQTSPERTSRTFYFLNYDTFNVKQVETVSTAHPDQWYVWNEGTFFANEQLFDSMAEVKKYAKRLLAKKVARLDALQDVLDNM